MKNKNIIKVIIAISAFFGIAYLIGEYRTMKMELYAMQNNCNWSVYRGNYVCK